MTKKPPPWCTTNIEKWTDDDDVQTCIWFQKNGINAAKGVVGSAVQLVAKENGFHPVRDYLNSLKWDKKRRINKWLVTYFGTEETAYIRAISPRILIGAVARIFDPGCQVDNVPIFEGQQNLGKSSATRELASSPWFTDRVSKFGSKDASMELNGVWIIELAELDALIKSTNATTKSFVTRRDEKYRPPYGKHLVHQPRHCVLWGTINPVGGYLKDPTGARRFWPIACIKVELAAIKRDRDQLWAEALVRYRAGHPWYLETPELEALATAEQSLRYASDSCRG